MCRAMVEQRREDTVIAGVKMAGEFLKDDAKVFQAVAQKFSETPEYVATIWKQYKEKTAAVAKEE